MPSNFMKRAIRGEMGGGISRALPQNLLNTQHTLLEDFETGWSAISGATIADDTTHVKTGTKSLQITQTDVGVYAIADKTVNFNASSYDAFRIVLFCDDAPPSVNFGSLTVILSTNAGYTKYFQAAASTFIQRKWTMVEIPKTAFSNNGSAVWTDPIVRIRLRLASQSGKLSVVSLDSLTGGPRHDRPSIMFNFDDGWASVYTVAYPYMKARNMVGTCYITTGQIGAAGYMTAAQLLEMYNSGWAIANHSIDSTSLTTLNQADQQTKLSGAKAALDALGMTKYSDMVAYPNTLYDDNTMAAMAALGYKTGRGGDNNYPDLLDPANNYVLGAYQIANTTTQANVKTKIDNTVTAKASQSLLFHKLVASPASSIEWAISDFQAVVDYVLALGVQTLNIGEFYNLQSSGITVHHR